MELVGTVASGMGRGADYIGLDVYQERFHDTLGFYPFHGTLNLRVDPEERQTFTAQHEATRIDAPVHNGERLSAVEVYPVTVAANGSEVQGALLELEITDHPDSVAEIIAPLNLREELDVTDGETVVLQPR